MQFGWRTLSFRRQDHARFIFYEDEPLGWWFDPWKFMLDQFVNAKCLGMLESALGETFAAYLKSMKK